MVSLDHIKSSAFHELTTTAIAAVIASGLWYLANTLGYSYGVTPLVSVGATLMLTVVFDSRQFGSNPGNKTCTYEALTCLLIFFAIIFYVGNSTFTSGPSAPKSIIDIITASIGMGSVIAFSRATYFIMLIISRFELPEL